MPQSYVVFLHALGLEALLRHGRAALHDLELLRAWAAARRCRAPGLGSCGTGTDAGFLVETPREGALVRADRDPSSARAIGFANVSLRSG